MKPLLAAAFSVEVAFCATAATAPDSLSGITNVRLKGYLGERLDKMIERHVVARDVDYITAPFLEKTETKRCWQTEFWGKWMHAATPYLERLRDEKGECALARELRAKVDRGLERILESQEPSGYIGNYPDELRCGEGWDVWGMKYSMMGLLHYYDYASRLRSDDSQKNSVRAINACRRLCDYAIAEIGPGGRRGRELWQTGNWSGFASSSILEPVMWLYKRTGERRYLEFAAYIVKGMTEPESGPRLIDLPIKGVSVADRNGYGNKADKHNEYVMKHNRWKAYEMMSCYQGLLDYVEARSKMQGGKENELGDLRKAAIMTAEDIVKEEINLAGGCASSEAWFHGARKQHLPFMHLQETCVTTTWMRFCEKLLDTTGDPKWADQIERTFYNAYLGALRSDGGEFEAYTPLSGDKWHGMHHCSMHTDCCTANGPRGFLCFLKKMFREKNGAVEFNFYGSALAKCELPDGRKIAFDMYSLYPRTDSVRIVSHAKGRFTVKFRIPAWSKRASAKVNGSAIDGATPGAYLAVDRDWALGDIVELSFGMPVVAHTLDHYVAFTRGPVLLARDSRFDDGDLMEPFRRGIRDGEEMPSFEPVRVPSDAFWMAFSAKLNIGSHYENPEAGLGSAVTFCDYASAGNEWSRKNFYRTWFPVEYGPTE